ncbi:MAG: DUF1566 domain-containing protein [Deltaproteobacteria bacterium]|nr:DUF1566 domain-containing protein [Deltaproteobacteria bacterium]
MKRLALPLFAILGLGLLLVAGACPEFGDDYPCAESSECINGKVCGSGGLCVDPGGDDGGLPDAGDDGGVPDGNLPDGGDDGGTPDAASDGGDDGGTPDAASDGGDDGGTPDGSSDGGTGPTDCTATYCPMPDSPTEWCSNGSAAVACADALTGTFAPQDGHHRSLMPSYTVSGQIVLDEVTDLWWQQIPGSPAIYTEAESFCRNLTLQDGGGNPFQGWRLPTLAELMSLADWGITASTDRYDGVFGRTSSPVYWSSEEFSNGSGYRYVLDYDQAEKDNILPSALAAIRCVRGTPRWQGPLEWANGSWRDPTTNLLWSDTVDQVTTRNLEEAFGDCAALTEGGHAWRLPSLKEWATVFDVTKTNLAPRVRDLHPADQGENYWSSTPDSESPGSGFFNAYLGSNSMIFVYSTTSTSRRRVMCVADGP